MTTADVALEHTTELALTEKSKLKKSLRRFDMVFFTLCALVGLDTLGAVASYGPQGFFWLVIMAITFVVPVHADHVRDRQLVHRGRRTVRVGEALVRPLPGGRRGGRLLGVEPVLGRRLAGVHRERCLVGVRSSGAPGRPSRHGRRLRVQAPLHLVLDRGRDRSDREGQVDPERRRDRARARARLLHLHARRLRGQERRLGLRGRRHEADARRLLRPHTADPLQLCRLRAPERRRRGDGQSAARRPGVRAAFRDPGRAALHDPRARDPARPAQRQDHRDRRLRRRRQGDVHRLRRRSGLPLQPHRARLHLHADDLRRRLDDRRRPCPCRLRLRRLVLPLVRRLQQEARDAGALQRPLGHRLVGVHDRCRLHAEERQRRRCVLRRARDGDVDDAALVPLDLPRRAEVAVRGAGRSPRLPRPGQRQPRDVDPRLDRLPLGPARLLGGGLPGHARAAARRVVRLQGHVGRLAAHVPHAHARHARGRCSWSRSSATCPERACGSATSSSRSRSRPPRPDVSPCLRPASGIRGLDKHPSAVGELRGTAHDPPR